MNTISFGEYGDLSRLVMDDPVFQAVYCNCYKLCP